jgi:putative membrane protein
MPDSGRPTPDPNVYLAAERTLLAWVRSGLAMMGLGFIVARFGLFLRALARETVPGEHPHVSGGMSLWFGVALIGFGVISLLLAARNHLRSVDRLLRNEPLEIRRMSLAVVLSALLAILGIAMSVYLVMTL